MTNKKNSKNTKEHNVKEQNANEHFDHDHQGEETHGDNHKSKKTSPHHKAQVNNNDGDKFNFSVEVGKVLQLMINSLYTNKDVALEINSRNATSLLV